MRHVIRSVSLRPLPPDTSATLDCGSLNFGDGNRAYGVDTNIPAPGRGHLQRISGQAGLEVFDTAISGSFKQMVKEGLSPPILIQLLHGHSAMASRPTWDNPPGHGLRCPRMQNWGWGGVPALRPQCRCRGGRSRCCSACHCARRLEDISI